MLPDWKDQISDTEANDSVRAMTAQSVPIILQSPLLGQAVLGPCTSFVFTHIRLRVTSASKCSP